MNTSNDSIIFIEEIQQQPTNGTTFNCKCNHLVTAISKRKHNENDNESDNESNGSEESYSEKRARWYQEDLERNDCLITIWKMDERLEWLLTHGSSDNPASHDYEYSPSLPEYTSSPAASEYEYSPVSPDCEENPAPPDNSPDSPESPVCSTWCYTCDYAYESCKCLEPFSPSDNYNPCDVCEWEQCKCLKLPIEPKDNDIIILDWRGRHQA